MFARRADHRQTVPSDIHVHLAIEFQRRYARGSVANSGEREFDMNDTSILVLGAGELGMPVLRNLARRIDSSSGTTVTVLLRLSSINPEVASKQRDVAELRSLGVRFLAGDLAHPTTDLPALFKGYHTVIGCTAS